MTVTLIRHGESMANAGLATIDPLTVDLTECGRAQAMAVAVGMLSRPSLVISSPAARAAATAAPVLQRFPSVPRATWPIAEFTYLAPARCAGTTVHQRKSWVDAYWNRADHLYVDGEGAESFGQFVARVRRCMDSIGAAGGDAAAHILIFGHGQFFNAMRWLASGSSNEHDMPAFRAFDLSHPIENCQQVPFDLQLR